MKFPTLKIVRPADLAGVENGKLPANLLADGPGAKLHYMAATAFNAAQLAAFFAGHSFEIMPGGGIRTFEQQVALFEQRYSATPTGRLPVVTRNYQGKTWYLKKGMSPAGTPGNSPHGWGLFGDVKGTGLARGVPNPLTAWMIDNLPKFGIYWEIADPSNPNFESWHVGLCTGNYTPAVLEAIAAFPTIERRPQ
jgi:hypothetical protein